MTRVRLHLDNLEFLTGRWVQTLPCIRHPHLHSWKRFYHRRRVFSSQSDMRRLRLAPLRWLWPEKRGHFLQGSSKCWAQVTCFIYGSGFWPRAMLKGPIRSFVVILVLVGRGEPWAKNVRNENCFKLNRKSLVESEQTIALYFYDHLWPWRI